tara:strand:+ start:1409 stop:2236 length:828 start_codon:yes stop_codon:yes gene_type:complete
MATEDFVGKEVRFGPTPVTADSVQAFCKGINEESPQFTDPSAEDFRAHPFHCVTSVIPASGMAIMHPDAAINFQKIVHAGIEINFRTAILNGDEITSTAVLNRIENKTNGRLLEFSFRTTNQERAVLAEGTTSYFERGESAGKGKPEFPDDEETATVLLVKEFDTLPNQSLLYAEGSGDRFPIHTSDDFARSVGLPGVILHGMCTLALSTRVVVDRSVKGDWGRLATVSCRFSQIAQPGERLRVIAYRNRADGVDFETYNMSGSSILSEAFARIH